MDLHLDPLDFQNFLLINPPLVEYSDYAIVDNTGAFQGSQPPHHLQRRLSISNGQISQISQMAHSSHGLGPPQQQQQQQQQSQQPHQHQFNDDMLFNTPSGSASIQQQQPLQQSLQQPLQRQISVPSMLMQPPLTPDENPLTTLAVDFNGVPTQPLLYDNKVIFDPKNGPIPGTSAWKKQRILERNRLAASKCREKKKTQQKKLAEELDDLRFERDTNSLARPIIKNQIAKWVKTKDPQLSALSDDQILKLVLFDGSSNDQLINHWLK